MASADTNTVVEDAANNQREATELEQFAQSTHSHSPPIVDGGVSTMNHRRIIPRPVRQFWTTQVAATVLHKASRDHFGIYPY